MRIVIVEDEIRIREGVERLIWKVSSEHEIVGCAVNGKEGLEMILSLRPDLVITDIKMPKMDGLEMLAEVKARGNLPKVIILTAYSEFEYARQAIKLGVNEYILKPVLVTEFIATLKKIDHAVSEEKKREAQKQEQESFDTIIKNQLYHGHQTNDHEKDILLKRYGFNANAGFCIAPVYLGEDYE